MPAPIPKRGTSPIVWVLVALGGLFLLFIVGFIGISALIVHKAREAGITGDLARRNPAAVAARLMAMANRQVEIVGEDDNAGTITLRDRSTGKVVTMSFDQAKNGIKFTADGDDGKTAELQFGGGAPKLPGWVLNYPGSNIQNTISAKGIDNHGEGQGGNYTFTTSDSPSRVMDFYQGKAKDMGMTVKLTATGNDGGTIVATDEGDRRSLTVLVGGGSSQTTVNVTYGEKR
jgi:hypothetical protein